MTTTQCARDNTVFPRTHLHTWMEQDNGECWTKGSVGSGLRRVFWWEGCVRQTQRSSLYRERSKDKVSLPKKPPTILEDLPLPASLV
eukprot:scaffold268852_cov17-Tisochrysis_lutea.AAC.2